MLGGSYTLKTKGFLNKLSIQQKILSFQTQGFRTKVDDYLQFAPIVFTYSAGLFKSYTRNNFINRTLFLIGSELIMTAVVVPMKHFTHVERPDQSNFYSFPSGHTAQAFVSAHFMAKELRHQSIWYGIGAYTVAALTGYLRMANNKHYISDVLFGAGVGIASVELSYFLGDKIRKRRTTTHHHSGT